MHLNSRYINLFYLIPNDLNAFGALKKEGCVICTRRNIEHARFYIECIKHLCINNTSVFVAIVINLNDKHWKLSLLYYYYCFSYYCYERIVLYYCRDAATVFVCKWLLVNRILYHYHVHRNVLYVQTKTFSSDLSYINV